MEDEPNEARLLGALGINDRVIADNPRRGIRVTPRRPATEVHKVAIGNWRGELNH